MKNQWLIWVFVLSVVVVVLFALNYQGANEVISLSELFPEDEQRTTQIEYEFIEESDETIALEPTSLAAPSVETVITEIVPSEAVQQIAAEQAEVKAGAFAKTVDLSQIPFTIQVASSKDKNRAEEALKKIKEAGHPAHLVSKDLGEKGTWHRIYIGNFKTKANAQEYLSKVKDTYRDSFVITPHK